MVPFNVSVGGKRVGITFESLFWFFVVTAGATVVGELVYTKYVQPYLNRIPNLPPKIVNSLPAPDPSVVSVQTPSQFNVSA